MVNIEIKNYTEAIMQLKKAIQLAPNNSEFHISLASCYEAIGDVFSQKDTLIQATKIDKTNTDAYYKLAMLYNNQHDNVNEIKTLEHIIELEPNHIDAKYQLALIKETQGKGTKKMLSNYIKKSKALILIIKILKKTLKCYLHLLKWMNLRRFNMF